MPSQQDVAVATHDETSLLNVIARAARDPAVDVAKLTALISLQERVAGNAARAEYWRDMALVTQEIEPIRKDASNPTFGRKYATLSAVVQALRPVYSRHGFTVSYGTIPAPVGNIGVSCMVAHQGGHVETLSLVAPLDTTTGGRARTPVQALGSSVTYLKRYLLLLAFPVSFMEEDDDGNGGGSPEDKHRRPPPPPRPDEGAGASSVTYPPNEPSREERRQTISEWLDSYERDIAQVRPTDRYAAEALLNRDDALKVSRIVTDAAKSRFVKLQGKLWEVVMANPLPQPAETPIALEPQAGEQPDA